MNAHDTQVSERAERSKALDEFANAAPRESTSIAPQPFVSGVDRLFGAQAVAVYRDEARILQKLKALAAAAGEDWYYRIPVRGKSGATEYIEGASIKLANDLARIYGNCDVDTRVFDTGDEWIFYSRFFDVETGHSRTRPFRQRKSQRGMKTDNDRALDIAFSIGASKSERGVITRVLQTFSDYAWQEARNSLVDKIGKDIAGWRQRTLDGLEKYQVELSRVETTIGRSAKEWLAPDIAKIVAMMKAVADGMATLDETFPHLGEKAPTTAGQDNGGGPLPVDDGNLGQFAEGKTADAKPRKPRAPKVDLAQASASAQEAPTGDGEPEAVTPQAEADNATSEAPAKPSEPGKVPTNEAEYRAYAEAWIDAAADAGAAELRWRSEKQIRNKANVSGETREELSARLDAKVAELKAGG